MFNPSIGAHRRPSLGARWATIPVVVISAVVLLAVVLTRYAPTYTAPFASPATQYAVSSSSAQQSTPEAVPTVAPTQVNPSVLPVLSTGPVSTRLVRIAQGNPKQYATTSEYTTWTNFACSAASITEVVDAWWGYAKYRISDVLTQETGANAISSTMGLLDNDGIRRTMRRFGFDVTTPNLGLDQLIAVANAGTPVIVGWPPSKFPPGHLLVVIGGDSTTVKLADSSSYNYQRLPRATFLVRWGGFAAIAKPDPYALLAIAGPTLKPVQINKILATYGSPMQGQGAAIAQTLAEAGLEPAMALAFFLHESGMGLHGEATKTRAWGNSRCVPGYACLDQAGNPCLNPAVQSCYAGFSSWMQGLTEWSWQMTNPLYAGAGLVLPSDIIPRYAPTSDNNNEAAYIAALEHSADVWRSGKLIV